MESQAMDEALVGKWQTKTRNWTAKSVFQVCQTWRTCSTVTMRREASKTKVVITKAVSTSAKPKFHSRASRA